MRLTSEQVETVLQTIRRQADESARVYLFGSRLDDRARGGDVDLFIETTAPMTLLDRARLRQELENQRQLPVDLVVQARGTCPRPFQRIARARAVPLGTPR